MTDEDHPDLDTLMHAPLDPAGEAALADRTRLLLRDAARFLADAEKRGPTCPSRACRKAGACRGVDPREACGGFACGIERAGGATAIARLVCFVLIQRMDGAFSQRSGGDG